MGLVFGVGFNDEKTPVIVNGKTTIEYNAWRNMLSRTCVDNLSKRQESYKECTVSDDFKIYSIFHKWYKSQISADHLVFDLDKDVLIRGNSHYSKDTCLLIPIEINRALTNRRLHRGDHPVGVNFHKPLGKFRSQISINGRRIHIGYYDNSLDAFHGYKLAREEHIRSLAKKYKEFMDFRAYDALMNYRVHISD